MATTSWSGTKHNIEKHNYNTNNIRFKGLIPGYYTQKNIVVGVLRGLDSQCSTMGIKPKDKAQLDSSPFGME
jgi:hypothetical protein